MEDNEQPPAPTVEASAPQVAERPLWELSRDEQRLLIITFVGGLASIIAGVGVIGMAIALVRVMRPDHFWLGYMALGTAMYPITMALIVKGRRSNGTRTRGDSTTFFMYFAGSLFVLFWIGLAAGIH